MEIIIKVLSSTVFLTIISGVIVFVAGQIFLKLFLEPVHEFKKTIAKISHTLIEDAHVIHNANTFSEDVLNETYRKLRNLSGLLQSHLYLIPIYQVTNKVFFLPSKDELLNASKNLIGLANTIIGAQRKFDFKTSEIIVKRVEKVCDSLDIYLSKGSRWPKG